MSTLTRSGVVPSKEEIPKGHRLFKVTGPMICDDTGAYCDEGDWAVLTKKSASHYLDLGLIRVELPENFDDDTPEPVKPEPVKTEAVAGEDKAQAKP